MIIMSGGWPSGTLAVGGRATNLRLVLLFFVVFAAAALPLRPHRAWVRVQEVLHYQNCQNLVRVHGGVESEQQGGHLQWMADMMIDGERLGLKQCQWGDQKLWTL